MACNDFGQNIQGLHLDGDAIVATDRHIAVFGEDKVNNQYTYLALDANGQLELAHDVNTNPVFGIITDANQDDLNIYSEGDVSDTGIGVMGEDPAGNMQFLAVDTNGELIVNVGAVDSAYVYGSANLVKDTATSEAIKAFSPALAVFNLRSSSLFCFDDRAQKPKKLKRP